ncbi:MAG: ParA family protein [Pseudomonadota bacterium]
MQILSVTSQKGGVGKTTLAMNLAVAAASTGMPTIVFDVDPQTSAADYYDVRLEHGHPNQPKVVSLQPKRLPQELKAAIDDGYELAIIDTPPAIDISAVHIAQAGDLVLIPVQPSAVDLRAIRASTEIALAAKRPGFVVLNKVDPPRMDKSTGVLKEIANTVEARALIEVTFNFPVAPVALAMRKAFVFAGATGQGVVEFDPDSKAADEVLSLWQWVKAALAEIKANDGADMKEAANG